MPEIPTAPRMSNRDLFAVGMVVVSVVLLTMIILTVWLQGASRNGTGAAVEDVLENRAESAASWVADYVEASESTTHGLALWLEQEPRSMDDVVAQLLVIATIDDQLTSTGVGFVDGSWVGIRSARPHEAGDWRVNVTRRADDGFVSTVDVYDDSLTHLDGWQIPALVTSLDFAFWPHAVESDGLSWITMRPTQEVEDAGVWVTEAIRDESYEPLAVVATEFPVDAMTGVLDAVDLGDQGGVFLLDADRRVIASPLGINDLARIAVGASPAPTFESVTGQSLEQLGLATTAPARPGDSLVAIGFDGELHTAELGLSDLGVPWVLHMRALDEQVADAIFELRVAMRWASLVMLGVLVLASALFFFLWQPTRDLHKRANTDLLTGLLRRGRFLQLAPATLAETRRVGHWSCAVVLDLDNFKTLNDEFGHETGDVALERVGAALRAATRSGDLVSRWGGDEFVALLELIDPSDALFAVERLREKVEAHLREEFPDHPELGVTAGGAVSCSEECDIETLVRQADEALVEGKRTRKSRTYMAVG